MLKLLVGAIVIFASSFSYTYLINTVGLQDKAQKKVLLYGDLHHVDECIDFAFTKRQVSLCKRKLARLKKKRYKTVKIWYEGRNKDDKWAQMNPALKNDLLPSLDILNDKKNFGLANIENRTFLVDCTLMGAKLCACKHIDKDIYGIKNKIRCLKQMGYYPEDTLEDLKAELERLKFVKSLPSDKELIERITTQLQEVVTGIETNIKDCEAQGTLSKKHVRYLRKDLLRSQKMRTSALEKLLKVKEGKRKFTRKLLEQIIMATFNLFDSNFVLQVVSDSSTKKHVLFAGCAHTDNIARMLKDMGFNEFCRGGSSHEDLIKSRLNIKTELVAPIHESDFNLIMLEQQEKSSSQSLRNLN